MTEKTVSTFAGFIKKKPAKKIKYTKVYAGFITKGQKKIVREAYGDSNYHDMVKSHSNDEAHDHLSAHYRNYNEAHRDAIKDYTGTGHESLNKKLYSGEPLREHNKLVDKHLSSALQLHTAPKDLVVHTGIKHDVAKIAEKYANEPHIALHLPAYTSTSLSKITARTFAASHQTSTQQHFSHNVDRVPDHIMKLHRDLTNSKMPDELHNGSFASAIQQKLTKHSNIKKFDRLNAAVKAHTGRELNPTHYSDHIGFGHPQPIRKTSILDNSNVKHVLDVHIPKGSHGGYVGHISTHDHENEFVLHKDAKLHVDKNPEFHHDGAHTYLHWKAKLVHDGVKPINHE